MNKPQSFLVAAMIAAVAVLPLAGPAMADTESTAAIVAAASAIVGTLLTDSNNQPYYVSNGRHVYVSKSTATYYRSHGNHHNQQHNNQQHNNQGHNNQQQYH